MAEVGDRVAVVSKGAPRLGVVTGVDGRMVRIRWDTGEETTLHPAAGSLRVVTRASAPHTTNTTRSTKTNKAPGSPAASTIKKKSRKPPK